MDNILSPCPFCGKELNINEDEDILYPTGRGWKEVYAGRGDLLYFVSYKDVPKEQWCWNIVCPEPSGGCGVTMEGLSKEDVIAKWNERV